MYDKLVNDLQNMSKMGTKYGMAVVKMREAADAIEELSNAGSIYGKAWTLGYDAGRDENMPRWIPVTERLPEKGNYVLVYEDGDIIMADYLDGEWYLRDMYEIVELKPTHWMPLPEPPKEDV